MSTICFPTKVLYSNGITTSPEEADQIRREIEQIAHVKVELWHNDTTPGKTVATIGTEFGLGLACGAAAIGIASSSKMKRSTKAIVGSILGIAALAFLGLGTKECFSMKERKLKSAEGLKNRIIQALDENPFGDVGLVLHSQGACIGKWALEMMPASYRRRIRVCTIGGVTTISKADGVKVAVNFQNKRDFLSQFAQKVLYRSKEPVTYVSSSSCLVCHSADTYVPSPPLVRQTIKTTIASSTCYGVMRL